ncbi:MAG TPA: hypothetical protein VIL86_08755 [Tepidisphaeraceae bacterium]
MPHAHDSPQSPLTVAVCMGRALPLRCPECGISPLFVPVRKVRSIWDWFTPLDGCPRCGYAYERETGYFLMAIGGVNYGIMAGLGLAIAMILDAVIGLSIRQAIIFVFVPMPIFSFLIARHAKALYLAMDHYFDPHVRPKKT